ncbi:PREDICTED: integrator complex subunit 4 [Prunus dulcis]|uniref:PREDICTED: integrator complex subunit 4 n=1 Tax=Prunus dulcis TaxID=3755 RepID=A0A5E4EFW2_PRUDU|nr:protein SIEL isoform X1 [Prunus dulcis]VVA14332.1 PREDICTED: integrator complex subunit 4 [Prunus dulcis]
MEDHVFLTCDHPLNLPTLSTNEPLSLEALASLRSLIINPSTTAPTISSVIETLTRSLQLSRDPLAIHHTLKLLTDMALRLPHLSGVVFDSVCSHSLLSTDSTRVAAESLDALASIAEGNRVLAPGIEELDDRLFASLCFSPSLSVRPWLLRNADRFGVQPHLLFTLFLGFTKDPYPYVRKVALDGLVDLSKNGVIEDPDMIEGCYFRAVELLNDMEDCVRSAAVRTVCAWGLMLVACKSETKAYWSDEVFVKLCSTVRDMSMEVRVEAFCALGKIEMVSEEILLQTLSKKVLVTMKGKKSLAQCSDEQLETSGSSVAGAFMHGLEDEFHEVRKAACHSLRTLTILCAKFAGEALNLLIDVLNDDSILVRLQAFETMHRMASFDCLTVQETHMHMFLGTLVDNDTLIRSSARKILKLAKLQKLKLFRLTIDALLENLERHPQDEADVLSVLFHIGRNHGKFVVRIIEEVFPQMEPMSNGKLGFDSVRVAALLVLAISAPLSHERDCNIPPTIFSYAVTYLGRISQALSDLMNQNSLLDYLSQCSRSSGPYAIEFNFKVGEPCLPNANVPTYTSNEIIGSIAMPLPQKTGGTSEILSPTIKKPREAGTLLVEYQLDVHDEVTKSMNVILAKVKDIWPFVLSGFTNEVLRTLRSCREELATFTSDSHASAGVFSFTKQYIQIVKLLTKAWVNFLSSTHFPCGMGELDLVLGKLDRRLRDLKSAFIRLSEEEELHILELILVTCMLRLSKVEICCHLGTLTKLSSMMSRVEYLLRDGSVEPSRFIIEVGKLSSEFGSSSLNEASFNPLLIRRVLESFSLKQLVLCGRLKHMKAELDIPDNEYENPLRFVAGLPVGIPCRITLHNISAESRLWLKMTVNKDNESTQFVFLDLNHFGGCDDVRVFMFTAPFYKTPKAFSFTIRVCICMECLSEVEDVSSVKRWGPRHELTYLCREKDVYLSMVK